MSGQPVILKEGEKWVLYSHDKSKKLGDFESEGLAVKREQEILRLEKMKRRYPMMSQG